jgi:hypothetical protein
MTHPTFKFKKMILAGGTMFAMLAVPMAVNTVSGLDLGVISSAQAAEDGGAKKGSANKGGAKKGSANKGGQGGASSNKIFRAPVSSEEEDSDRPVWAGVKGGKAGGGGKPPGAGSKKGDLFGDMVILLRDTNGEPILTTSGLVQVIAYYYPEGSTTLVPLKDAAGNLVVIPYNTEGDLLPTVTVDGKTYDVFGAEVDLGRLSVGRAPTKVLDHSLTEALAKLTSATSITLDSTGRLVVDGVTIDSPLENLALYLDYMPDKTITGVTLPAGFNPASLFAAAADKTGSITVDTVVYMNSILGINNLNSGDYYDFDTYNYDRYTTFKDATAMVLVLKDGVYVPTEVNLYEAVFNSTNWVDPTPVVDDAGADDFAAAADDYLQVIEFVHDNAVR